MLLQLVERELIPRFEWSIDSIPYYETMCTWKNTSLLFSTKISRWSWSRIVIFWTFLYFITFSYVIHIFRLEMHWIGGIGIGDAHEFHFIIDSPTVTHIYIFVRIYKIFFLHQKSPEERSIYSLRKWTWKFILEMFKCSRWGSGNKCC
jgi:hypothetical protein